MKDNQDIFEEVEFEILRQIKLEHGGDTIEFDMNNEEADWAAFIAYYASRSIPRLWEYSEGFPTLGHTISVPETNFREDMIKVAALAVAAIKALDKNTEESVLKIFADAQNF